MKNKIMGVLAIGALAVGLNLFAAAADKEKTITGDGACGKCILKETKQCQHTIAAEEDGRQVTYYVAQNEVDKKFGNQLCEERKKVKATGTVKTVDGKPELTPTKIELIKE